jgi:heme-degrading monooxygenase HmoA
MENHDQIFTTAVWTVKKGKEEEFIKQWTEFAKWTNEQIDNGSAKLLQDSDNSQRFTSVGKWNSLEAMQGWRERSEFKDFLNRITELLTEPTQPHLMREAAKVGEHEIV